MSNLPQEITYNNKIYTIREFSELIGSNMGWLQSKLSNGLDINTILNELVTIKPPTLRRNVRSLSKISGITKETIFSRIDNGELFGDIKEELLE